MGLLDLEKSLRLLNPCFLVISKLQEDVCNTLIGENTGGMFWVPCILTKGFSPVTSCH